MSAPDKIRGRYSCVFIAGIIYIITISVIVLANWINGIHVFDMRLTVSLYIALDVRSSVLYFASAVFMCVFLVLQIRKTDTVTVRKLVYYLIITGVMGCAWFPCASQRSRVCASIHNYFAYGLILTMILSLIFMLVSTHRKRNRIFAVAGLVYAAIFVYCYFFNIDSFKRLLFVWENLFIFLLLAELLLEETKAKN